MATLNKISIFVKIGKVSKLKLSAKSNVLWPIVALTIALAAFYFKPWQTQPPETISVTATGKTDVTPDIAKITAAIQSKNPDLNDARAENEKKVSTIISELSKLQIDQKDIKTEYISGGPSYEPDVQIFPAPPRPNTNQLTTTLEITVRNFDNANEVLATLTAGGATSIYGPNLTISDEKLEEAKSRARQDAVESAKQKAQELAKLSGRKLGKATKIQEQSDFGLPIPILAQSEADLRQKASLIAPGQSEVTITLLVDFALK